MRIVGRREAAVAGSLAINVFVSDYQHSLFRGMMALMRSERMNCRGKGGGGTLASVSKNNVQKR